MRGHLRIYIPARAAFSRALVTLRGSPAITSFRAFWRIPERRSESVVRKAVPEARRRSDTVRRLRLL